MSNLIPPLLSDTPPPIMGHIDEDDDEFDDFRAAQDTYDCDDFSLPSTPHTSPNKQANSLDINRNNSQTSEDEPISYNEKDFQDRRKSAENTVNYIEEIKPNSNKSNPIANGNLICNSTEIKLNGHLEIEDCSVISNDLEMAENCPKATTNSDGNLSDSLEEQHEFVHSPKNENQCDLDKAELESKNNFTIAFDGLNGVEKCTENSYGNDEFAENDDEDFGDFTMCSMTTELETMAIGNLSQINDSANGDNENIQNDIDEIGHKQSTEEGCSKTNCNTIIENNVEQFGSEPKQEVHFGQFENAESYTDAPRDNPGISVDNPEISEENLKSTANDDEFGDFENATNIPQPTSSTNEDFGDFATAFESSTEDNSSIFLNIHSENIGDKTEMILKQIFEENPPNDDDYENFDTTKNNQIFDNLKDLSDTHAVNYQWSKSKSHELFLKALNIDVRNILHGPVWNSSMPRFAANLGSAPLEPVKSEIIVSTNVSSPSISSQKSVEVPTAQFDWNDSGLINPLDSTTPALDTPEDEKKLDVCFVAPASVQEVQPIEEYAPGPPTTFIPLRETHISSDFETKLDWLKPTIVTPDLPRKDMGLDEDEAEDDFADFQMVLPEVKVEEKVDECREEFSDFHASVAMEPVKPPQPVVPLEPLKPALQYQVPAQINWPNPGVSDEDILNFELTYSRNDAKNGADAEMTDKIDVGGKKKVEDEDEWSDFVSVAQPIRQLQSVPERISTPDLPLSVLNLNSVKAPKMPIPRVTPNGLVQAPSGNCVPSIYQSPSFYRHAPMQATNSMHSATGASTNSTADDDDDWSDFVSGAPPAKDRMVSVNAITNIITNPGHYDLLHNYSTTDAMKNRTVQPKSIISSISAMPELDFIAPKNRTNRK